MDNESLVTVIVPVYKTEKYLDRCVESIVNQTYRNLEIILIEDGSPDRCPQMCDAWARKDSRIVVIHQENAGQSAARNVGLDIAKGNYILFVDSDDYILESHIMDLYNLVRKYQVDLAVCEFLCVDEYDCPISKAFDDGGTELFNTEKTLSCLLEGNLITHGPIVKLYSKKLFANTRFPIGKIYEDVGTTYRLIMQCSKVAILKKVSYYYVIRSNSTIHSQFDKKQMDVIAMKEKMCYDILEDYPELEEKANADLFGSCVSLLGRMDREKDKESYLAIEKRIAVLKSSIIKSTTVRFKYRVFAAISYLGKGTLYFFLKVIINPIRIIKRRLH